MSGQKRRQLDFKAISATALSRLPELVERWLPDGQRKGSEYIARNPRRADMHLGSFTINLGSGQWADFATNDKGGDPISLRAYIDNSTQLEAARTLASELGMAGTRTDDDPKASIRPITPVPADAPPVTNYRNPRLGGAPVAVWPYRNRSGQLIGFVARFEYVANGIVKKSYLPLSFIGTENAASGWKAIDFAKPWPLYRLPDVIERSVAPVLVVEGEKAADAAANLLPDYVVTTPPHGAKSAASADWSVLSGRNVVVWPDNDSPGRAFADDVVRLALAAGAAEAKIVSIPDCWPEKWDLADHPPAGVDIATVRQMLADASPASITAPAAEQEPAGGLKLSRFKIDDNKGVYQRNDDGGWDWLCSPLYVLGETRDINNQNHGRLLEVVTTENFRNRWAMPMLMLAGDGTEYRRELLRLGLRMAPGGRSRDGLHNYLSLSIPDKRYRCVEHTGWYEYCYVTADRIYGNTNCEEILLQAEGVVNGHDVKGSFKEWQESVAALAVGNSRLVVAISAALAGPLLYLMGDESGGLHLSGGSSTGKTSALRAAASVWGCPVHTWRATDNAIESLARGASDAILCLDEISQCDGKAADAISYMLGNGAGKARMRKDATSRPVIEWRVLFLSTGETGLAPKLEETGRCARAGQSVRLIEIPADTGQFGLFENLHGFPSGAALSDHLRHSAKAHCGHAAQRFLEIITGQCDGLADAIEKGRQRWLSEYLPPGADGQVTRAASRFGLVATAGEFAVATGILPWADGEASRGAAVCFTAWLAARGGVKAAETITGITRVRAFIAAHGSSRFEAPWDNRDPLNGQVADIRVINRAGYRRRNNDTDDFEYMISTDIFTDEICKGVNAKAVAAELVAIGALTPGNDGKSSKLVRIPSQGLRRVYVVNPAALEGIARDA